MPLHAPPTLATAYYQNLKIAAPGSSKTSESKTKMSCEYNVVIDGDPLLTALPAFSKFKKAKSEPVPSSSSTVVPPYSKEASK